MKPNLIMLAIFAAAIVIYGLIRLISSIQEYIEAKGAGKPSIKYASRILLVAVAPYLLVGVIYPTTEDKNTLSIVYMLSWILSSVYLFILIRSLLKEYSIKKIGAYKLGNRIKIFLGLFIAVMPILGLFFLYIYIICIE